jgi:uncharacterized membrane protein
MRHAADAMTLKAMSEIDSQYYTPPEVLCEMCKQLQRELVEAREIAEMQKETMRQMREQYGLGERNVMRELRQEIENLNKIIEVATNSANASHLRAIEYQSQCDTLVEALDQFVNVCDYAPPVDIIKHIGESCASARKALSAVKGGES